MAWMVDMLLSSIFHNSEGGGEHGGRAPSRLVGGVVA